MIIPTHRPTPLADGEDLALARTIEAGVFARELLLGGDQRDGLRDVVDAAQEAAGRLWEVGIRIAAKQARRIANAYHLPFDDLFQDCCVAVAECLHTYDFTRRIRFTTYVFDRVRIALAAASEHRVGHFTMSRHDRTALKRAVEVQTELAASGREVTLQGAAHLAGVTQSSLKRATIRAVPLEGIDLPDEGAHEQHFGVEARACDVLALLTPRQRQVLAVRYGLDGSAAHTLAEASDLLGASRSTVHRWEREALTYLRKHWHAERTTAVTVRAATAVA